MSSVYFNILQKIMKSVKAPSRHTAGPPVGSGPAVSGPAVFSTTPIDVFNERRALFASIFAKAFPQYQTADATSTTTATAATTTTTTTTTTNKSGSPKVIHVAGTKGKGSTVELIAAALRAPSLGLNVGVFTSPHLHTARERIKIGDQLISIEDFIVHGNKALAELQEFSWVVFFDYLLAMSIDYFGTRQCDYIVLETGIGGRFDSTNFHSHPAACVITSISLDHQAVLGDTVEQIAWQKAGIIKRNSHVFTTANQPGGVLDVISKQCDELDATLHIVDTSTETLTSLSESGREGHSTSTVHETHLENLCLSRAVLSFLQIPPEGMRDFYWPCRMETINLMENTNHRLDGSQTDTTSSSNNSPGGISGGGIDSNDSNNHSSSNSSNSSSSS